jgi:hypothetical protein
MIKSLRDQHGYIRLENIKATNSTWITKKLLSIISVDPNIFNKELDIILNDKFRIKPHLMQLWRSRTKAKEFMEGSHKESYKRPLRFIPLLK